MASRHTHPHSDAAEGMARDEVRLSLVVAACLLVEAVVAKEVLDVRLDYFSQFVALWVFIAYMVTDGRDMSVKAFAVAAVVATAAVLGLYAI